MVLGNKSGQTVNQVLFVSAHFKLRCRSNSVVQVLDEGLELGDKKGRNDAPRDRLLLYCQKLQDFRINGQAPFMPSRGWLEAGRINCGTM